MTDNQFDEQRPIATWSKTKEILGKHQFTFKKSLGQNFIVDQNLLDKMIDAADVNLSSAVMEIGPGIGALTQKLAQRASKVFAIEIDQRLIPVLTTYFQENPHVYIHHGDILKMDLQHIFQKEFATFQQVDVIANLPYYITTPILFTLLESRLPFHSIVVMIQKEVAERIAAKPGTKDYNHFSIAIQYYCVSEIISTVPRTVFIPKPHVDSAILRLQLRKTPVVHVLDETFFFEIIKTSFAKRRKTILNNLMEKYAKTHNKSSLERFLQSIEIDPTRRAETLHIQEFAEIANALYLREQEDDSSFSDT